MKNSLSESKQDFKRNTALGEWRGEKNYFFLHRHFPICILKHNNKDSWVLLFVVNSFKCLYATFSLQIQTIFQLVMSILLASWSLFSTKAQVGNQLSLLFHSVVTHFGLNMQLQCIYMEICSERKNNRKNAWELAEELDFLACFFSETAGLGGEKKQRRGESGKKGWNKKWPKF